MAATIGYFLGALIATFLLSRLFLWLGRGIANPTVRIVVAHAVTLGVIFVAAGFGTADGGPFKPDALIPYLLPAAIWIAFDVTRVGRRAEPTRPTTN